MRTKNKKQSYDRSCVVRAVCSLCAAEKNTIVTIHADEKTVARQVLYGSREAVSSRGKSKRLPLVISQNSRL